MPGSADGLIPGSSLCIKSYYTFPLAPNPRIVDIFAREKNIDLSGVEHIVDLTGGANRKGSHIKRNPGGQVPYLELLDGTIISESIAICEYFEDVIPRPALLGSCPVEKACTRMWLNRMQEHYVWPALCAFRCWTASDDCTGAFKDYFKTRGHAALLPDSYKEMQQWALARLRWLEQQKSGTEDLFVCGNNFTLVDIQMYAMLNGFSNLSQPFLKDHGHEMPWMLAWFERVASRNSVKLADAHAVQVSS